LRIRHEELRKLVAEAPVATKLIAVLSPSDMARDAYLSWGPYLPAGGKVYSPGAALTLSGNVSALLFMALVVGWWLIRQAKPEFQARKWRRWLAPVAVAAGMVVYFLGLPKVGGLSLRTVRVWGGSIHYDTFMLALGLGDEMADPNVIASPLIPTRPLTASEEECLLGAVVRGNRGQWSEHYPKLSEGLTNLFTGELIRFEASPGNVVLRPAVRGRSSGANAIPRTATNGYELVWHDLDGAEAVTNSVPPW
jgi:hypothetical protein